jgi:hypothetical protein
VHVFYRFCLPLRRFAIGCDGVRPMCQLFPCVAFGSGTLVRVIKEQASKATPEMAREFVLLLGDTWPQATDRPSVREIVLRESAA